MSPEHCVELERWRGSPNINKVRRYWTVWLVCLHIQKKLSMKIFLFWFKWLKLLSALLTEPGSLFSVLMTGQANSLLVLLQIYCNWEWNHSFTWKCLLLHSSLSYKFLSALYPWLCLQYLSLAFWFFFLFHFHTNCFKANSFWWILYFYFGTDSHTVVSQDVRRCVFCIYV